MAFVYWIHLPEHTDIFSEGYVGITSNSVDTRFKEHKRKAKTCLSYTIAKAIRKYGEALVVSTIIDADIGYCADVESKLRPLPRIGWNIGIGGAKTRLGQRHTDEAKLKQSKAQKGRPQNYDSSERLRRSVAMTKSNAAWNNPVASCAWLQAEKAYHYFVDNPTHGVRKLATYVELTDDKVRTILAKFRAGWNPSEDEEYKNWLITQKESENVT